MKRLFLAVLISCSLQVFSQVNTDVYVRVDGKVMAVDSITMLNGASLTYEKLPYYDDMGIGTSKGEGDFQFYLIKGTKYNFRIKKDGYLDYEGSLEVKDPDEDQITSQVFYLEPIPEEPEPELITLENLIFARGSDRISATSYKGLDDLVIWLDERPSMVIQLEGHTDFAGNADANMRLSQARVEAVKEYLLDNGVKKNRVLTKAFGGSQPLSVDRTDEAKAKNRRVEVRVISR